MKKLLFIAVIASFVLSFSSCEKTKEELLKEMIETKLKETMNDPNSYEFVSISQADSLRSTWENEDDAKKLKIFISMYEAENKTLYAKSDNPNYTYKQRISFVEKVGVNNNKIDSLEKEYLVRKSTYIPYSTGCYFLFKFRGTNSFGAKVLNTYKVILDKELSEIKTMELVE